MELSAAHTPEWIPTVRELFCEYADAIQIDLCFQEFEKELRELPGKYAPPSGRLYIALENGAAAGCVALRSMDNGVCEMKRLYVRPGHRRLGLGSTLAQAAIRAAQDIGYSAMRLDTLRTMHEAMALYRSLGFVEIPAYYPNPLTLAAYFELKWR
jgi:ribosomal protein S18 acetylase RimI-like enzyme